MMVFTFAWDLGINFFKRTKFGDWWVFKKTGLVILVLRVS